METLALPYLEEFTPQPTHQPYDLIGLDLELPDQSLKVTPKSPRSIVPGAPPFRASSGPDLAALGPAL